MCISQYNNMVQSLTTTLLHAVLQLLNSKVSMIARLEKISLQSCWYIGFLDITLILRTHEQLFPTNIYWQYEEPR